MAKKSVKKKFPVQSLIGPHFFMLNDFILFRVTKKYCTLLDLNSGNLWKSENLTAYLILILDGSKSTDEILDFLSDKISIKKDELNVLLQERLDHFLKLKLIKLVSKRQPSLNRQKLFDLNFKKLAKPLFPELTKEMSPDILVHAGGAGGGAGAGSSCCGS